tara:strand:- start:1897 stop:4374 length:2478 start_codon:yes stop_codon:yes gene_type:complete
MATFITSKLFYDDYTSTGGGGTEWLNLNVCDRATVVIEGYIAWNLQNVRVDFVADGDTIEITNELDQRTWDGQEFKVGDTVTIVGTTSNNGNVTITAISEDGKTITVAEALVNESATDATFHGVTAVTSFDLYYNLITNQGVENYESFIDEGTVQRFTVSGFDATDTLHYLNFRAATKSIGWVTNTIVDAVINETDEVTIIGAGIIDYKQFFTITQEFDVTPFTLIGQEQNLTDNVPPNYYRFGRSLKYICRIDAKYYSNNPNADHTGSSTTPNGNGTWFDQTNGGDKPQFKVLATYYTDNDTFEQLFEIDPSKNVLVTIELQSLSSTFTASTDFVLGFFVCPISEQRYQNTVDRNLRKNFFFDYGKTTTGTTIDGHNFGTQYQVFGNITGTYNDTTSITITALVQPAANLYQYWDELEDQERQYVLFVSVQNPAVTTTSGSDRVVCLADFNSAVIDQTNSSFFEFTGSGYGAYQFPDSGIVKWASVNGQSGTPFLIEAPFRVYNYPDGEGNTPTIKTITWQVVAIKTGVDDFVIEERTIGCSGFVKLLDVQQISIDDTRRFTTYEDDPFNAVTIERDAINDTGTMAAYIARYGIILRWEDWIDLQADSIVSDAGTLSVNPIRKYIADIVEKWANYSGVQGWDLKMRFECVVTDLNNIDQTYQSDLPMSCIDNATTWAGSSGTSNTVFFQNEAGGVNYGSILKDGLITKVKVVYAGDYPIDPTTDDGWYGFMRMNVTGTTVFESRFASSEVASESDSPWVATAPAADVTADISYANGSVRIDIFNPTASTTSQINISAYFDSSQYTEGDEKFVFLYGIGTTTFTT